MARNCPPPDEFDDRIDVLGLLYGTDQQSAPLRGSAAGEQEQSGRAVADAEALGPDQDTTATGPDRLPEDLGEILRLALGHTQMAAVA
ncbi:hypothetical protein [Micromonospora sp. NPDC047730]|uniref:hypothetical protein n=1 Tax=Micromonospora sp. NPDC047730 TaxID=3364253 RepID=UPI003721CD23